MVRAVEYKARIRPRNVIITFIDTFLDGCLSQASLTALIPSLLGMLVYKDLTSNATSKLLLVYVYYDLILPENIWCLENKMEHLLL